MSKTNSLFHKFKTIVGYSIAVVVIVTALAVSGLRFLLTTANLYQNEVEQLASSLLLQPVKIGRMDARLSGLVPTLIFHDVELISKKTQKPLFSLSRIDVGILFNDLLFRQKITPTEVTIKGMNLHVTRTVEGNLKIKGVDIAGLSNVGDDELNTFFEAWLLQQGEIGVEDSTFIWKDEQNAGITWFFDDLNLLLKKSSERYQLLLSSKLPKMLGDKITLAVDLVGDITSPATWNVKTFVGSTSLDLSPVQSYIKIPKAKLIGGIADLKLWFNWENESIKKLSGDVKLYDFSYQLNKKKKVTLKSVSGIFDSYINENNTWNVSVNKFLYKIGNEILNESNFSLAFNYNNNSFMNFYLNADYLKLGTLSQIISDNHLFSTKNEERIKNLNIQGDIRDFTVAWQNNELSKFTADFSGLGMNSWQSLPQIKNLSGSVVYEQKEGKISLLSDRSTIGFPELFRDSFKLDKLSAEIFFSNTKQGFLFDVKNLLTKNIEVNAVSSAKLWLPKNDASAYLDLQAHISEGDVSKVSHYLPVSIMDKALVDWLDSALLEGKVDKSTVIFNGKLNEFPFDNNEGVFSVAIETSGLTINYMDGWPKISKAEIAGNFTGQSLKLNLLSAEVEKNLMYDSQAEIVSFSKAELQLELLAKGETVNSVQYLVNSPVLSEAKETVASMRFLGDIFTNIKMNIPLDDETSKEKSLSYSGSAELKNISIFMLDDKLGITEGNGKIFFTEKNLSSKDVLAKFSGERATFLVSSLKNNKGINIATKGKIRPGVMLKTFDIPGANKISGITSFKSNMFFPDVSAENNNPVLKLESNLIGVKSVLPDYFFKNKKSLQKFYFTTEFTGDNKIRFGLEFGSNGSAILELDQSTDKIFLNKGAVSASDKKAVLPRKNVLYVDGDFKKLTPSKWFEALDLNKKGDEQSFFVNPVVFNLDSLEILLDENDTDENIKASNPKKLPAAEGIIKKLYLDNTFLGRLDFKLSKKHYGLHFDEIILSAKNMKLFSRGDWRYSRGKHETNMDLTLSSQNFGGMLTDLGFSAIIDGGVAQTVGNINWPAAPGQFSLSKLNGKIQLKIKDGNIKEVDAEAGRLLGLFSLSALPRKLFGDFKDTFKSGFNFDTANGEIIIENGDAYTEDFEISSTVAEISLSGRTGLEDRDYENIIEVVPEVGEGLAGVTALLVNLPAGIGLWLIDKITGEQFNEASTRTYEISGSWDEPDIQLIEDEDE